MTFPPLLTSVLVAVSVLVCVVVDTRAATVRAPAPTQRRADDGGVHTVRLYIAPDVLSVTGPEDRPAVAFPVPSPSPLPAPIPPRSSGDE